MSLLTRIIFLSVTCQLFFNCQPKSQQKLKLQIAENPNALVGNEIFCNENACQGTYLGAEFICGSDVAHQFSNQICHIVGNKLKEFYRNSKYKRVDFSNIKMTTKGMGTGIVEYFLRVPFISVDSKCQAYTSFDHVGGWNHAPALLRRKKELNNVTMEGDSLDISNLKKTPEGLEEYWIQWRNKFIQKDCID